MRLLILASSTSAFFNLYQLQAIYPWLAGRLDASLTQAGWLNMATLFGMMLTAPFANRITRGRSSYSAILMGVGLLIALNVLLAFSTTLSVTWWLRVAQGVVLPCVLTSTVALLAQADNEAQRARRVGFFVAGTIIGSTLSRFYPAWALDVFAWRGGFLSCAVLLGLSWLAIFRQTQTQPLKLAPPSEQAPYLQLLKKALLENRLAVAYCVGFTLLFTQSAVFTVLGLRLAQAPFNYSSAQIGLVYLASLPAIAAVIASPRLYRNSSETRFFLPFTALLWVSLAFANTGFYTSLLSVGLFAISTYLLQTLTTRMVSRAQCVPASFASGLYLTFYYAGGALGATLAAFCYSHWGWAGALALVGVVHVLTLVSVLALLAAGRRRDARAGKSE
ncbi:MFS transporter [Vreelandella sp. TE19]